ncbi:class I SAM-dependent methyltransferase [Maridesulfovibrio ferrireducens]|uniref:class I SAM-dependent methyltransferase n=1 Tax=Maridesulfovibrio ferrireducens TaxID=246191 RepID=UPI001A345701|nr:class I SAM-dependent methyltransferase [Maridesulfovibrio ferrireducens]MBI9110226.1 class I SAM-dependent methyltransferase [Maridesulfovibrio ferrireducens]
MNEVKLQDVDWVKEWRENMSQMNEISSVDYWNGRADDYDDFICTSEFSYGYEIVKILEENEVVRPDLSVLEIASGVGAVTIPLARKALKVTGIEPAQEMAARLAKNSKAAGVDNIEVKLMTGQEYAEGVQSADHGLSLLCHASWQFPEIAEIASMMENGSSEWCCICDTALNRNSESAKLQKELGVVSSSFDRVEGLYNGLKVLDRKPEIKSFDYIMRRSVDSAYSMLTKVLTKQRVPTENDIKLINDHIERHSDEGVYNEPGKMSVIWWRKE